MNKPKEFYIYPIINGNDAGFAAKVYRQWAGTGEQYHVIEKKAYEDALRMLDEMAFALETIMSSGNGLVALSTLENYRKWNKDD